MYFSNRRVSKRFWTMVLIFFLCATFIMPKGLIRPGRADAEPTLLVTLVLGAATGAVLGVVTRNN